MKKFKKNNCFYRNLFFNLPLSKRKEPEKVEEKDLKKTKRDSISIDETPRLVRSSRLKKAQEEKVTAEKERDDKRKNEKPPRKDSKTSVSQKYKVENFGYSVIIFLANHNLFRKRLFSSKLGLPSRGRKIETIQF